MCNAKHDSQIIKNFSMADDYSFSTGAGLSGQPNNSAGKKQWRRVTQKHSTRKSIGLETTVIGGQMVILRLGCIYRFCQSWKYTQNISLLQLGHCNQN